MQGVLTAGDAYLIYPVPIHSRSVRTQRVNPRKVYIIDTGLTLAFSHQPNIDRGRLLENLVFMELRRQGVMIEYYRSTRGFEVDFIITLPEGRHCLIQVALAIQEKNTYEREVRALRAAMSETAIGEGTLVTLNDEANLKTPEGVIQVVPAWFWLLQDGLCASKYP